MSGISFEMNFDLYKRGKSFGYRSFLIPKRGRVGCILMERSQVRSKCPWATYGVQSLSVCVIEHYSV